MLRFCFWSGWSFVVWIALQIKVLCYQLNGDCVHQIYIISVHKFILAPNSKDQSPLFVHWIALQIKVHCYQLNGDCVHQICIISVHKFNLALTSKDQSPLWEADRSSASQEIPPVFIETGASSPHSQVPATCS